MGVKFSGTFSTGGELEALLMQDGQRAIKHGIEAMRREGEGIAALARAYAPVDEGDLENAIKVEDAGGGRDALGRFVQKAVRIFVDEGMPGSGGALSVGDYAYLIHEGQVPEGDAYGLGPKSVNKMNRTGLPVGGGFLRRALEDSKKDFFRAMVAALSRGL